MSITLTHNGNSAKPKPLPLALQKKIKKAHRLHSDSDSDSKTETDSYTQTSGIAVKKARPGSDMAIMVEDLQSNGVIPPQPQVEKVRPKPREGSDMAEMLANIDKQKNNLEHTKVHVSNKGTIALLEEHQPPVVEKLTDQKKPTTPRDDGERTDNVISGGGVAIEGIEHAGNQSLSGLAEVAGEVAEQGAQLATQSFGRMAIETAVQVGSALSGFLVAPLLYRGAKKLREGFKEDDLDKKLDGANNIAISARSAATSVTMANLASGGSQALGIVGEVAKVAAPVLGVATAGVDGFLGIREITSGKDRVGGWLRVGFAVGVGAAALGAGPLATIATGGFLAARVGRAIHKFSKQRKAKKLAKMKMKATSADNPAVNKPNHIATPDSKASSP